MNRRILLIALACMCLATICRAQTENAELPLLKGTWKLDSIVQKQDENKTTALLPSKIIPDTIYYSCPVKISFDREQDGNCHLLYENEKAKDMSFHLYKYQNTVRLFCAMPNNKPIHEWSFDYLLTTSQDYLILAVEYNTESSNTKIIYEYIYSLINQINML
ncbi:MAG: hypothetical protein LBP63_04255 [Prevotellaceae bacterium]|jgi:hypothetical protein|nr:hypothetical protein [Prevotellaceae bacterium]